MKRIIGVIGLYKNGSVVQTLGFAKKNIVHASAVHAVQKFYTSGVDEIVLLDLTDDGLGVEQLKKYITEILRKCFIPVIYAGFIKSEQHVDELFTLGIDRLLSCSSLAVRDSKIASYIIDKYGSQAFVAGIDSSSFSLSCRISGRLLPDDFDTSTLKEQLDYCVSLGISEVFLNSDVADGSRQGYALSPDTKRLVDYAQSQRLSLVVMGGAWDLDHFSEAAELGFAGLAAANCFHYREAFPLLIKKHLKKLSFDVVQ